MYPNSDPGMFWVAFYGCLLAEVIPVPIEVPLSRKVRKPSEELVHFMSAEIFFFCLTMNVCVCVCVGGVFRTQVSARWGFCSAAVVLVWL